jgi:putative Mg2+ transporter-C (MgtC) family protein
MLPDIEMIARLLLAALLGSLIGLERERISWAAGLRTHMLVCVGSCLLMIVSAFGFADILSTPHVILDPSRIAAQVVSGIGFLGAGAILMRGEVVRGLTTAASVWAVAAIGLTVGSGLYSAAIAATTIILIILAGIKPIEERFKDKRQSCIFHLRATRGKFSTDSLKQVLGERTSRIKQFIVQPTETGDADDVTVKLSRISAKQAGEIEAQLRALSYVQEIKRKLF